MLIRVVKESVDREAGPRTSWNAQGEIFTHFDHQMTIFVTKASHPAHRD